MVKVKTFVLNSGNAQCHHSQLDDNINKFIEENDIEVIDIKYSSAGYGDCGVQLSAMVIYSGK